MLTTSSISQQLSGLVMVECTIKSQVTLRLETAMIDADPRVVGQQRVCALILVDYAVDPRSTRTCVTG